MALVTNSRDTVVSESEHMLPAVTPATLATLSSGEFVGILEDGPVVREIGPNEIDDNSSRVKTEVRILVESEMKRIMRDPKLKGVIGKGTYATGFPKNS